MATRCTQLRGVALWSRVCLGELTLHQAADLVPVERCSIQTRATCGPMPSKYREYTSLYRTVKGFYHRLNADIRG